MFDFNILNALIVAVAIVVFITYVLPYFRDNDMQYYEEVKIGLLMFGYAFRDEKLQKIADMALAVVLQMEILDASNKDKYSQAVEQVFRNLIEQFNIFIPEDVIGMIVNVAVTMLPKTNKKEIA